MSRLIPDQFLSIREAAERLSTVMDSGEPDPPLVKALRESGVVVADGAAMNDAVSEIWRAVDHGTIQAFVVGAKHRTPLKLSASMSRGVPILRSPKGGGFTLLRPGNPVRRQFVEWFGPDLSGVLPTHSFRVRRSTATNFIHLMEAEMSFSQFYQTTLVDSGSNLSATLAIVSAGALAEPNVLSDADVVCDRLDLTPRYESQSPSSLPCLLATILIDDEAELAMQRLFDLHQVPSDRLWEKVGPELYDFVEELAYGNVVPFVQSPIELLSLATIAKSGAKAGVVGIGFTIGLVAAYGMPLVLVTVPAGIVLCGAAVTMARIFNEGLGPRLVRFIKGEKLQRSRPRTPHEKIVASVIPHRVKKREK